MSNERIELNGDYSISATREGDSLHLQDDNDMQEVYISADHFKAIAKLMGYQPIGIDNEHT